MQTADTAEDMSSSTDDSKNAPESSTQDPSTNLTNNRKTELTQVQIDEVIGIMNANMEKFMDSNEKVSNLEEKAESIHMGAKVFQSNTSELQKKYFWKDKKMLIVIGLILVVIVIVILVVSLT
ncbi:vesicle-associated membrane protein 1-like [Pyxicephalus adspersus]|uniref:vesicle-associated membrane protein 1-like n=1 Tax=Pyxicephalus adspersus TaxID=30357 RepID=UPI003B58E158